MTPIKRAYICGPLTDLPPDIQESTKSFYSLLGDVCERILGVRAFVPHEHYDPVKNKEAHRTVVYNAEHEIVTKETSVLIVYAVMPSWGGGIEVGWSNEHHVPIIVFHPSDMKVVSRLLTGGRMVVDILPVDSEADTVQKLESALHKYRHIICPNSDRPPIPDLVL